MNNLPGQCSLDNERQQFCQSVEAPLALESVEPQEVMDIDSVIVTSHNSGAMEDNNEIDTIDNDTNEMVVEGEITEALSAKVFENEMLREMILQHVIYPNNNVSRVDLNTIRLVRKSWLRASADLLRKHREPLFVLVLDKTNSVDGCPYIKKTGSKLLDQFVHVMTPSACICDFTPTFCLKLLPDFFRRENYKNFSDCLVYCGEGLVHLDLSFPVNSSMTFVFHSFFLPKLQRLSVQFSDQRLMDLAVGPVIQNNGHTIYPLQTILNGTEELKELRFKYTSCDSLIPFGFEYLALPETITSLYLDCPVKNSDLHLLIKNSLPNLASLRLFATNVPYADGLIFKILEKYRTTLKLLSLIGHHYHGRVRNTTLFQFPVMEKLEVITVTSQCWEFEDDLYHLERQLPKLKELKMRNTRESMFAKWTERSKYTTVKNLFVSLINVNVASFHPYNVEVPLSLNLERMQSLHRAFPNVTCLEVTVWGSQTCGLKHLFMEMTQLKTLAIMLKGADQSYFPYHWDSLFVGVPADMLLSFRNNPEYWDIVDIKDDNNFPSIRKLKELKSLALVETLGGATPAEHESPLITDLTFHFAFFRMPNLRKLLLHGKFLASSNMSERWLQEKGTSIDGMNQQMDAII